MSEEAKSRQAHQDAEAKRMYQEALNDPNLDPRVRAIIEHEVTIGRGKNSRRVTVPRMDDSSVVLSNKASRDAADSPEAQSVADFRDTLDSEETTLVDELGVTRAQARKILAWHRDELTLHTNREVAIKLARVASFMFREENLKQTLVALMFVTWTAASNGFTSMRKACLEIPKPGGGHVTVQSLSKVTNRLCSFLGMPPGEGMKTDASVEVYRASATAVHKKKKNERLQKALKRFGENHG